MPNSEQIKSILRWVISTFGATLAGFLAGKGIVDKDALVSVLNSEAVTQIATAAVMPLIALTWSIISRREKNITAATAALSNVAGVITTDTPEGKALAKSVPDPSVAAAGTVTAAKVAGVK